jgi:hypothetical protein
VFKAVVPCLARSRVINGYFPYPCMLANTHFVFIGFITDGILT